MTSHFLLVSLFVLGTISAGKSHDVQGNHDFDDRKILDYKTSNFLLCNYSDVEPVTIAWTRRNEPIESAPGYGTKFKVDKNKLFIIKPTDEDMVNYTCTVSKKGMHIGQTVYHTIGKPSAKLSSQSVTVIEGEKLRLECLVTGLPKPTVEWKYEDKLMSREENTRVKIVDNLKKGIIGEILEIYPVVMADRGEYSCSTLVPYNYNITIPDAKTFVRVKDKYAALWPFIGICIEVILLCAIIFIYERKRNKTELEESDTDQSPDQKNTPDHGKESVRQRK